VSFDATGKERWRVELGPFHSFYGLSSSPVVYGQTVALVCDQPKGAYFGGFLDPDRVRAGTRSRLETGENLWWIGKPTSRTTLAGSIRMRTAASPAPSGTRRYALYLLKRGGIVTTLDPSTGDVLKTGRTKDAIDGYFASPVAADGKGSC